jgi:hypothetical protein
MPKCSLAKFNVRISHESLHTRTQLLHTPAHLACIFVCIIVVRFSSCLSHIGVFLVCKHDRIDFLAACVEKASNIVSLEGWQSTKRRICRLVSGTQNSVQVSPDFRRGVLRTVVKRGIQKHDSFRPNYYHREGRTCERPIPGHDFTVNREPDNSSGMFPANAIFLAIIPRLVGKLARMHFSLARERRALSILALMRLVECKSTSSPGNSRDSFCTAQN